jgi:hypothetical protein
LFQLLTDIVFEIVTQKIDWTPNWIRDGVNAEKLSAVVHAAKDPQIIRIMVHPRPYLVLGKIVLVIGSIGMSPPQRR